MGGTSMFSDIDRLWSDSLKLLNAIVQLLIVAMAGRA